jgi:single-strand DNA-binding protein
LGQDPSCRYSQAGDAVTSFSLATEETWKGKDGQKQTKTSWHNCTAFKRIGEVVAEYCSKGSLLYVEGKIDYESWTDKEGNKKTGTKIIVSNIQMLGGKGDGAKKSQSENTDPTDDPNDIPF